MQNLVHYECGIKGLDHWTLISGLSRGKCKSHFLRKLDLDGVKYTDIAARRVLAPISDRFSKVAKNRRVPKAHIGMTIDVDGRRGKIAGYNSHENFDVIFDNTGERLNCHPNWKTVYYLKDGSILYDFREN